MKQNIAKTLSLLLTLTITSCANNQTTAQKVDQAVKNVSAEKTESIDKTAKLDIMNANIPEAKKSELLALEEKSYNEYAAITEEIEKVKVVLIETALSSKMNKSDFKALKRKLRALDAKRLENGFNALENIQKIVSPESSTETKEAYKAILFRRYKGM